MAAAPKRILGDKHLKILTEVIQMCHETLQYCDECTRAGLNVDHEKRTTQEQLQFAQKLKGVFFPNSK
jgi:hypothetical protein